MTIRTTINHVSFARPFALPGMPRHCPAGTYGIETVEELVEGLSFPV